MISLIWIFGFLFRYPDDLRNIVQQCAMLSIHLTFASQFKIDAGTIRLPRLTEWKAAKHKKVRKYKMITCSRTFPQEGIYTAVNLLHNLNLMQKFKFHTIGGHCELKVSWTVWHFVNVIRYLQLPHQVTRPSTSCVFAGDKTTEIFLIENLSVQLSHQHHHLLNSVVKYY